LNTDIQTELFNVIFNSF